MHCAEFGKRGVKLTDISKLTFGVGTHGQLRKKPHHVLGSTCRIGVGLERSLIPIRVNQYCCTDSSGDIFTCSRFHAGLRW
jgi:hypothetical protein